MAPSKQTVSLSKRSVLSSGRAPRAQYVDDIVESSASEDDNEAGSFDSSSDGTPSDDDDTSKDMEQLDSESDVEERVNKKELETQDSKKRNLKRKRQTIEEHVSSDESDSQSTISTPSKAALKETLSTLPFGSLLSALPPSNSRPAHDSSPNRSASPPLRSKPKPKSKYGPNPGSSANLTPISKSYKRSSKNAPQQLSTKHAVPRFRTVVGGTTLASSSEHPDAQTGRSSNAPPLDPRFSPLTGYLSRRATRQNYAFLTSYRRNELSALKTAMKSARTPAAEKAEIGVSIKRLESALALSERQRVEDDVRGRIRKEESERVKKGGKGAWFEKEKVVKERVREEVEGAWGAKRRKKIEGRREKRRHKSEVVRGKKMSGTEGGWRERRTKE